MIAGRCLCGAVTLRSAAQPLATRACWCRLCQYLGAGSATVNVVFPSAAVTVEGPLSSYESIADSGARMTRSFCPTCGTPVLTNAASRPHLAVVRAGVLDDPEIGRPAMTIWTAAAPSWACIAEDLPRLEGQPPPMA